jgi:hypothetical protein
VSTYRRQAHTRTVNGRVIQVRASKEISKRGSRDRQAADARQADPDAAPAKTYRRSTWVGATGAGLLLGGGRMMAVLPNAGAVVGVVGIVLVLVAVVVRVLGAVLHRDTW